MSGLRDLEQRVSSAAPALIRSPTSMLRAVMMPSNGATTREYDSSCSSWRTFALFGGDRRRFALRDPTAVSTSCCDTALVSRSSVNRFAVASASCRLASAAARVSRACWSCWSTSGVSISASSSPCFTRAPMSTYHFFSSRRAREDRRARVGLDVAGQHQSPARSPSRSGRDDRDIRRCRARRSRSRTRSRVAQPRQHAGDDRDASTATAIASASHVRRRVTARASSDLRALAATRAPTL